MITEPVGVGRSSLGAGLAASGGGAGRADTGFPRLKPSSTIWNSITLTTGKKIENTYSGIFCTVEGWVPGRKPKRRLVTTAPAPAMVNRMIYTECTGWDRVPIKAAVAKAR